MATQLRGLLDRNVLTIAAIAAIVIVMLVAAIAAVTGHYDSASVRAFIDDMKYLGAALGLGAAVGRGLVAAGQRIGDGHTEAVLARIQAGEAPAAPPADASAPEGPPLQPSQTGAISS